MEQTRAVKALWIGGDEAAGTSLGAATTPTSVEVVRASELTSGLATLADGGIDVVLLELVRRADALEALTTLHDRVPDVPVVVLTAPDDEALGLDAVQRGAQDWLATTQAEGTHLTRALRYAIERHRLQRTLRELSLTDDLTGLYNRRGFLTLCDHHLKLARRTRGFLLAKADIVALRAINAEFGYEEGDRALRYAAEILRNSFRVSDVVARLAADEFAVLVLDAADETARIIGPRLEARLAEHNAEAGARYTLSIRMGHARCGPDETPSIEELLARAAIALAAERR
jgi:two-component system cell cycle response regulator